MYTKDNINLDIIKRNCQEKNVANEANNCVLITTGSLNPIHRSHLKNISLVKAYLEKHKDRPLNVLAAYLSPSHDSYVRHKLGEADWISGAERSDLCHYAIKHDKLEDFVSVSKGELECRGFVDFDQVIIQLERFLNHELHKSQSIISHPLKVVYVCGLDHFNKCPYVETLAEAKNVACAVIYRLGASDDRIKRLQERNSKIYYITLDDERETLVDISSTEIRKRYRDSFQQTDTDEITYPFVQKYLTKKYQKH
ncbi:unnamed protein product [Adineta ricciae]|uniref:Cytidyltransferase-like domain-containing protein n=1 Tax=Adineta ricciae TaxID=249248 RepID=A0A815IIV8_ADIRI|nr:unnamed protein product [Adineta ricciae]